ncbi:LOW QUALITY PROTEIN: hypothetical protein PanWU01x14_332130 [Parasponia andersonii]|uniref:Uncharacterized protein n=1 Tax=Parasponia andersonii TaxID=3476 RepID=A0A2P5AHF0_PARAD|nr:LOW QUALITY PROTEIN: hypothetical protein PanWU01x14_332130 [Parasponia andersonii]
MDPRSRLQLIINGGAPRARRKKLGNLLRPLSGDTLRNPLRVPEQLLPANLVEVPEQLLLQALERHVQPLQLLHGVLVVHEEPVVEVEAVPGRVVDQIQQGLVPLGVDRGGLQPEPLQDPTHRVCHELGPGREPVVLGARHLHHATPLPGEDPQELVAPVGPVLARPDPDPVEDEGEPDPGELAALGPEHGVGAEDVELGGQVAEEEVSGELLDGEDVDEEGVAAEPLERDRLDDLLGGEDGGAEDHDLRVLLAEVVRVAEEGDAELLGRGGVVGPGMGQDGVALPDERLGEELPEVSEPDYGDFERGGLLVAEEGLLLGWLAVVGLRAVCCC